MQLTAQNLGKRYNREWIFRHLDYEFTAGVKYAITGANGSGKSTLLQVLAGSTEKSEGELLLNGNKDTLKLYEHISIAAPYLELVEEMTALELLDFHGQFKPLTEPAAQMLEAVDLTAAANKQIRYYSSGMKQRLKLAQAFFSNSSILLLDEPTTNLDAEGIYVYNQLMGMLTHNRLVIISSNDKAEYGFCEEVIEMNKFKGFIV